MKQDFGIFEIVIVIGIQSIFLFLKSYFKINTLKPYKNINFF
jgi:hypothetical protein